MRFTDIGMYWRGRSAARDGDGFNIVWERGRYPSGCTSACTVELHANHKVVFQYNDIYGAPNQAGVAIKEFGDSDQSDDDNTYYHSPSGANWYYDGAARLLSAMQDSYSLEIGSDVRDPNFTDPDGSDDTYGTADDDYSLQSDSDEISAGSSSAFFSPSKTMDIANSDDWMINQLSKELGISNGILTMNGKECLSPSTDWTATKLDSSTVVATDWDTVGHINRGAYADANGDDQEPAGTVIDDDKASATGLWLVSTSPNPYGSQSLYTYETDATYSYELNAVGTQKIQMWWTTHETRSSSVPVEIYDGDTLLDTVHVNQQEDGGQWNSLGT